MKALIVFLMLLSSNVHADSYYEEFIKGYKIGVCWRIRDCEPPPVALPKKDDSDPYMRGLSLGLVCSTKKTHTLCEEPLNKETKND